MLHVFFLFYSLYNKHDLSFDHQQLLFSKIFFDKIDLFKNNIDFSTKSTLSTDYCVLLNKDKNIFIMNTLPAYDEHERS